MNVEYIDLETAVKAALDYNSKHKPVYNRFDDVDNNIAIFEDWNRRHPEDPVKIP